MERFASFVTGNSEKCRMSPCTVVMPSVFYIVVLKYLQKNLKIMCVIETFSIQSLQVRASSYNSSKSTN
jgi:hypothetical protein